MNIKKLIGDRGERKVAKIYQFKGYKIIARNFSCKFGELDIVAQKGDMIVIIEVKTRKNDNYAQAKEFVDYRKQNRIRNTADLFLQQNNLSEYIIRFDVAEVYTDSNTVNIIENAF
ncbi:MAG: YraN family protein [Oscillospiraceae bacterium]|nr:YraN family protein [Oscillospiraceae bacterium]